MASVNFYTRSKLEKGSDIVVSVIIRDTELNVRVSTGIKIPFEAWNDKKGSLRQYYDKPIDITQRLDIAKKQLDQIKDKIELFISKYPSINSNDVKGIIKDVIEDKQKESIPFRMNEYIPYLIEQMKNGTRKTKEGGNYAVGTIKSWNTFFLNWLRFQEEIGRTISFEDVTIQAYNQFIEYCEDYNFTADTTRKHIITWKAIMNYAFEDKLHTNLDYKRDAFSKSIKPAEGKRPYLNTIELDSLFNLVLTDDTLLKVRDIFLIGCYTGQRVSDYARIGRNDITQTKGGYKYIELYQKKTKNKVKVPFLDSVKAEAILKRWEYNLPSLGANPDVIINRHIKEICRMANIVTPFTKETKRGSIIDKDIKDKCDLITTHTARRSAITNLYKEGILTTPELMYISGHKTEKAFNNYICLSNDETLDIIINKLNKKEKKKAKK